MLSFYIINLILLVGILVAIFKYIAPMERTNIDKLNKEYDTLLQNGNQECINYLQILTGIPSWRVAVITGVIYTLTIIVVAAACGFYPTQPVHFFLYWGILLSSVFLIYKLMGTINFHYVCHNTCLPLWSR